MMACFTQGVSECRGWEPGAGGHGIPPMIEPHLIEPTPAPAPIGGTQRCWTNSRTGEQMHTAGYPGDGFDMGCASAPAPSPAPAGAAQCSTTATRGSRNGVPCPTGQTCVITDPGHPEYDSPNSGYCQAAAAQGNSDCWSGRYDFDFCCAGAGGNTACWGGQFTYDHCCDGGH